MSIESFPDGSDSKESACSVGDLGLIPGLGWSPGEGNSYPLQYSGLENSTDRGAWHATVRGVTKSQTQLSKFHFHLHPLSSVSVNSHQKQWNSQFHNFHFLCWVFYDSHFDSFWGRSGSSRVHFILPAKSILLTTQWDGRGEGLHAKVYSTENA